ncbi:MAG: nicotinic acid mononucleotide adenyltransferase [Flavobacteriaceae bacterium]|nr:nicotinic acid mononucleotide adenyltransferase [Flavobacteriaceae bacterium]
MRRIKLLSIFTLLTLLSSCYVDNLDDDNNAISLNELLRSYELWYVDINQTVGNGQTPFLQKAFTISFRNSIVYANNNLVGIGSEGNGYGISIGVFDAYEMVLDVNHDLDGLYSFDVYQIDANTIELYNPYNDTSYFLHGYQRHNFDYDFVFYDNIHYFLQEYVAWEKTYTSDTGAINAFDNENYLQFLAGGTNSTFRSSQDVNTGNIHNIYWDYTGIYAVNDINGNNYLKNLTLDYNYSDNESFELNVINDELIELYHLSSGTLYQFTGRGYIQYFMNDDATIDSSKNSGDKLRIQDSKKTENPRTPRAR